jgi:hypothetical protein
MSVVHTYPAMPSVALVPPWAANVRLEEEDPPSESSNNNMFLIIGAAIVVVVIGILIYLFKRPSPMQTASRAQFTLVKIS